MDLPESLQLARTLNANPILALAQLQLQSDDICGLLKPLLPYLTLPALLLIASRPSCSALFPPNADDAVKSRLISELIDFQRDWLVEDCPVELRDEYLVDAFAVNGQPAWSQLTQDGRFKMVVPRGTDLVVKASATATKGQVCASLHDFQSKLKEMSGGLLEKLDWSNVCLGGGAVLGILTGKMDDDSCKDSDLDLFIHGLEPGQLIPKIESIIQQIRATMPKIEQTGGTDDDDDYYAAFEWESHNLGELLLIKGFNAISVVPPKNVKPRRVIQIISAANDSVLDAVADFDMDCCSMAYNGTKVLAMPRAARSLALGDWTSGVNLLDTRLSRKLDPSSSTCASRTIKYTTRGFALALPPAAADHLVAEKEDFVKILAKGKAKAAKDDIKIKVEELKGLAVLFKREVNSGKQGRTKAELHADYGPSAVPYWKILDAEELRCENGTIQHEYAEFNVKIGQKLLELTDADKGSIIKSKAVDTGYLSTWAIPYVASFDEQLLLGQKTPQDVKKKYFFSRQSNQQLVVKIPRSIVPLADAAQARLNHISAAASDRTAGPSQKKSKSTVVDPILKEIDHATITEALSALKLASIDTPPVPAHSQVSNGDEFIPESLTGPHRGLGAGLPSYAGLGGYGLGGAGTAGGTEELPSKGGKLIGPLLNKNGKEEGVCNLASTSSYFVATLAGLLQFARIDPEIDRVKDLIWQAWCITARAAVSLPQPMDPMLLMSLEGYEEMGFASAGKSTAKEVLARYQAQPTVKQVLNRMEADLDTLEKLIGKSKQKAAKRPKVGDWDGDRKKWLMIQWIRNVDMI